MGWLYEGLALICQGFISWLSDVYWFGLSTRVARLDQLWASTLFVFQLLKSLYIPMDATMLGIYASCLVAAVLAFISAQLCHWAMCERMRDRVRDDSEDGDPSGMEISSYSMELTPTASTDELSSSHCEISQTEQVRKRSLESPPTADCGDKDANCGLSGFGRVPSSDSTTTDTSSHRARLLSGSAVPPTGTESSSTPKVQQPKRWSRLVQHLGLVPFSQAAIRVLYGDCRAVTCPRLASAESPRYPFFVAWTYPPQVVPKSGRDLTPDELEELKLFEGFLLFHTFWHYSLPVGATCWVIYATFLY